ncbi:copper resistance protein NlpE [Bordetella sp. BOR01]|uniref:copper resistance protein NlpE n=1 Tax=Bordetella sp. BOR01 TaxID=2854779 RepID=UPI001C455674|nr:copper resistance protein NlpE [Bordetella sp. BOR01]MBV7486794.1 copper resistance protein NlpE [Bordetella sp. BOR01]
MKAAAPICLLTAALLAGCAATEPAAQSPATSPAPAGPALVDGHNARNSLDWAGVYEGTLPCADCPGIQTRLMLAEHGAYELQTQYLDRQPHPNVVRGTFQWQPDGTTIRLDKAGDEQRFFVAEGRLIQLYQDGSRPTGPLASHYELTQVR